MDGKEIEVKIELSLAEYNDLIIRLNKQATLMREKHQIDIYYSPIGVHYYDYGDRCLRVRAENNNTTLSFKRIYEENTNNSYIEEYETKVSNITMLCNILDSIDFKREITVDKYRMEFKFEDLYIIALDKVDKLGYFIEVENINEKDSIKKRNSDLIDFIKKMNLNLDNINHEGYSNMLYRKNRENS